MTKKPSKNDKYYLPIIYLVKKHGSINGAAKALGVSQQKLFYWNKNKIVPDDWKIRLHKEYQIPYARFFDQLE